MQTLIRPRAWLLALLAAVAVIAAACGGSSDDGATTAAQTGAASTAATSSPNPDEISLGAAGTDGKGAAAIPADALAFASVNIDQSSDGWKQMIAVASRFPGFARVSADFQKSLTDTGGDGTDFATDIRPWLGGEVALGVLGIDVTGGDPQIVLYVETTDEAATAAALVKGGKAKAEPDYQGYKVFSEEPSDGGSSAPAWAGVGEGALLVAMSEADLKRSIDTRKGTQPSIATAPEFTATLGRLNPENIAVAYVNGQKLGDLVKLGVAAAAAGASGTAGAAAQASQAQLQASLAQLQALKGIGMAFRAEDAGFRAQTIVLADDATIGQMGGTFDPKLDELVPGDAVAYVGFKDLGKNLGPQIDTLLAGQPGAAEQLQGMEQALGLSIKDDVIPLLLNEHALFVSPGLPVSVGLLLTPSDPAAGGQVLRQLTALAQQGQPGLTVSDVPGGQQITMEGQPFPLVWRQAGNVLALSNLATAGDPPAASLAQDPAYTAALEAAGVPGDVSAIAFVDVQKAVALGQAVSGSAYPPDVTANVAPLKSVVLWATSEGDIAESDVFVQVG